MGATSEDQLSLDRLWPRCFGAQANEQRTAWVAASWLQPTTEPKALGLATLRPPDPLPNQRRNRGKLCPFQKASAERLAKLAS